MTTNTASAGVLAEPARRHVLNSLKTHGPRFAADIASDLNVTATAVRQHLQALEAERLVRSEAIPEGRGRPKRIWSLTENAERLFPDAHQALAVELIKSVEALFGADGLNKVADRHAEAQRTSYSERLRGAKTLEQKLRALTDARAAEGYMATLEADGSDWLLAENHCPICSAAQSCTRLCANELKLFQSLLGDEVDITRENHILSGARRCLYRISSKTP